MNTAKVEYHGAIIEVATFLVPFLSHDLPLNKWPSFCGAGDGIGDWIVPDKICGVVVSPECLDHDVSWAVSPNTYAAFQAANNRLLKNLVSRVGSKLSGKQYIRALLRCVMYYVVVSSWIGWRNFEPCGKNPWSNPVVRERLNRLTRSTTAWREDK